MTNQLFGSYPATPFALGAGPAAIGMYGNWPQAALPVADLTPVIASLLALLQGQGAVPYSGATGLGLSSPLWTAPQDQGTGTPIAPEDERWAAETFLRDITAAALRNLYKSLETAAAHQSDLAPCYKPLHQAVRAYRVRDYHQALSASYEVYRLLAGQRSRHPEFAYADSHRPAAGDPALRRT
jgi:hypothetical protein